MAGRVGEAELVTGGEPKIAGAGVEDVPDFAGDDRQEYFEFESGGEGAAKIVERGEAFEGGELSLAFAFDGAQIGESLPYQPRGLFEEVRVVLGEIAGALVEDFHNPFGAVDAGDGSEHGGLDADAAGFFEVFEVFEG